MANYEFRYANLSGGAIRTTVMQCAADDEAIHLARDTMKDHYATLEIFEGDRPVFSTVEAPRGRPGPTGQSGTAFASREGHSGPSVPSGADRET